MFGGNKSKDSQPKPAEQKTQSPPVTQSPKIEQSSFNLTKILDSVQSSYDSMRKTIKENKEQFQKSQAYTTMVDYKNSVYVNFCTPLGETYRKLPFKITDWKFDLINGYTEGERLMAVNTLALFTALFTFRNFQATRVVGTSLRAIKNTAFMYLGAGLIIAPQIYNPIMKNSK